MELMGKSVALVEGGKSRYTRATTGSVAFQKVVNGGSRVMCTGSGAGKRISFAPVSFLLA